MKCKTCKGLMTYTYSGAVCEACNGRLVFIDKENMDDLRRRGLAPIYGDYERKDCPYCGGVADCGYCTNGSIYVGT